MKTSNAAQHVQVSRVGSFIQAGGRTPASSILCLPCMHLHRVSCEETPEGNIKPFRFVNSAKIHPLQYIYIPFTLQLEIAVFCPFQSCYLKSSE